MEWLFGKRITPEEMLRKNQRALNKAMRDLDREKMRMEQQEKKIIIDIKKLAKEGQMVSFINILKNIIFFYIIKKNDWMYESKFYRCFYPLGCTATYINN